MRIVLEYDEATGALTDKAGIYVSGVTGLTSVEPENNNKDTIELVKLGVSSDDIIKMKHNGLIK